MKHLQNRFIKLKYIIFALAAILCLLPRTNVKAYSVVEGQHVYDDAGLFTNDEIGRLDKLIEKIEKKDEVDLYVLTTSDAQGYTSDIYNDYFFDEGHNKKQLFNEDTIILLINMENREVWLNCYGSTEETFDSDTITSVTDNIASYLSDGDYYEGCKAGLKDVQMYLEKNYVIFHAWFQIVVALGISGIIVAIMACSRKTPMTANANTYFDQQNSRLRFHHDNYIRTTVTKVRKPQNNSSGGGGGSGHHSGGPSGHSHSGGGSHF